MCDNCKTLECKTVKLEAKVNELEAIVTDLTARYFGVDMAINVALDSIVEVLEATVKLDGKKFHALVQARCNERAKEFENFLNKKKKEM